MAVLFAHVTAVTMDAQRRILKDAYVAVEGTRIVSVGTQRPRGRSGGSLTGPGRRSCPALSTPTPICP